MMQESTTRSVTDKGVHLICHLRSELRKQVWHDCIFTSRTIRARQYSKGFSSQQRPQSAPLSTAAPKDQALMATIAINQVLRMHLERPRVLDRHTL